MNNLYDNGTQLLGEYRKIIDYTKKQFEKENLEDIQLLLEELEELQLDDDTIVCINYDCGMGSTFDWWEQTTIID